MVVLEVLGVLGVLCQRSNPVGVGCTVAYPACEVGEVGVPVVAPGAFGEVVAVVINVGVIVVASGLASWAIINDFCHIECEKWVGLL